MVDGVHGHHVQPTVVVALKPAHAHVPHPPMVVLIALALILNLATPMDVLNHVQLVPIHQVVHTCQVQAHVRHVQLVPTLWALAILHALLVLLSPLVALVPLPSALACVKLATLAQQVDHALLW